jgi:hypothetical protein
VAIVDELMREPGPYDGDDYSALDVRYRAATGHELVRALYESLRHHPQLTLSASVVVPSWNDGSTLGRCLTAIARGSFNR